VKRCRGFVTRLDVWLAENGLAESREKAQALVMAGRVRVNGQPAGKPGTRVKEGAEVAVDPGPAHVGRGALKLARALDVLAVDVRGRVAVDVGASTGGFTETLLARGATRVYAVDVGRGQLHERLRTDSRVVVLDRTNARSLSPRLIGEPCSLASLDVSFISATKILPALHSVLAADADVLVLVKPQFEVGRSQVGRGGIVKEPSLHRQAVRDVAEAAEAQGYAARGACASPITGAEGNREFFLHLVPGGPALGREGIEVLVRKAVEG
jgi:23S rRNA (cytidine1920-2'-O)/16S rRNA (cytidine1409-2'-O)-methyltransferase